MSLYNIRLVPELDEGVYTVTSPDVPGLVTEGRTPDEIRRNVQEAIDCMVEVYQREGWDLPDLLKLDRAIRIEEISTLQVAA